MRALWADIEALDNTRAGAASSTACSTAPAACCGTPATGCCANAARTCTSRTRCANCAPASSSSTTASTTALGGEAARATRRDVRASSSVGGVPEKLARRVARLALLEPALDIVALARSERAPVADVARVYFELGVRSASTGCTARSTGSRSTAPGRPRRAPACAMPPCARIASSPSRCCARAARKRVSERLARWSAQRADALAELEAHAHRDARGGHRGLRHTHRGRRRGARPRERLRRMRLALVITTYERPDALAAVLASVARQQRRARRNRHRRRRLGQRRRARSSPRSPRAPPCRCALVSQPHEGFRVSAPAQSRDRRDDRRTTWCSSTATCCCIPEFIADHARLARRGFYTQGVRVHADAALTAQADRRACSTCPRFWSRGLGRAAPRSIYCTRRRWPR